MNQMAPALAAPIPTLPGWTYGDPTFFRAEREQIFLDAWQFVGHISEIAAPGDFLTLTMLGERALVIRGEDGMLRAFANICRHRASAVALGEEGNCKGALRCPYHGWTYGLDGKLKAVPGEASFPGLDKSQSGLKPLPMEIFMGFIFVRFRDHGPSIAERFAPFVEELTPYRLAEMVPMTRRYDQNLPCDWKNAMDNYLEGYHIPVGHPGLYRLFGTQYSVETFPLGVSRALSTLRDKPSDRLSERLYQQHLPEMAHLPPARRRIWAYYTLLPNIAFDIYPDCMDIFQIVPVAPGKAHLRGRAYRLPNPDRRLNAVQQLNMRINNEVQREDNFLTETVQEGLTSRHYGAGLLSDKEVCVRQLHDFIRERMPLAHRAEPPIDPILAA